MADVLLMAARRMKYRTRRLEAGDVFECAPRDARVFKAARLATETTAKAPTPPAVSIAAAADEVEKIDMSENIPAQEAQDANPGDDAPAEELDTLRAQYMDKTGNPPHRRWGAARIKRELAGD